MVILITEMMRTAPAFLILFVIELEKMFFDLMGSLIIIIYWWLSKRVPPLLRCNMIINDGYLICKPVLLCKWTSSRLRTENNKDTLQQVKTKWSSR